MELKNAFKRVQSLRRSKLEHDACDFWIESYFVPIILLLTMISSSTQFVGGRFSCAYTTTYPGTYMSYIASVCWTNGTYGFPIDEPLYGSQQEMRSLEKIYYYPMIAVYLVACAGLLLLPGVLYRCWAKTSGIDSENVLRTLTATEKRFTTAVGDQVALADSARLGMLATLGHNLNLYRRKVASKKIIHSSKVLQRSNLKFWSRDGSYLTRLFLAKKILTVVMPLLCIHFLHCNLLSYWDLGPDFLNRMYSSHWMGNRYNTSRNFPLFFLCDTYFTLVGGNNQAQNTAECIQAKNIFYDIFFTILYFLFLATAIGSLVDLAIWTFNLYGISAKRRFIKEAFVHYAEQMASQRDRLMKTATTTTGDDRPKNSALSVEQRLQEMCNEIYSMLLPDLVLLLHLVKRNVVFKREALKVILANFWMTRKVSETDPNLSANNLRQCSLAPEKKCDKFGTFKSAVSSGSSDSLCTSASNMTSIDRV